MSFLEGDDELEKLNEHLRGHTVYGPVPCECGCEDARHYQHSRICWTCQKLEPYSEEELAILVSPTGGIKKIIPAERFAELCRETSISGSLLELANEIAEPEAERVLDSRAEESLVERFSGTRCGVSTNLLEYCRSYEVDKKERILECFDRPEITLYSAEFLRLAEIILELARD